MDLGFDIVDCVAGLDFEGDGLAGEGFDEAVLREGQLVKGGGEGEYLWDEGRVKKERRGGKGYICTVEEKEFSESFSEWVMSRGNSLFTVAHAMQPILSWRG